MEPQEGVEKIATDQQHDIVPYDIVREILLTLPPKSLLRFKAVCKPWRGLISDPHFIKSHLTLATKARTLNLHRYGALCLHENLPRRHPMYPLVPPLNDDYFRKSHVSFSSINREVLDCEQVQIDFPPEKQSAYKAEILGSCDGLLLINTDSNTFLWNPSTRKFTQLQAPDDFLWLLGGGAAKISGLGYDSVQDKYKAVVAIQVTHTSEKVHFFLMEGGCLGWERGRLLDYESFDYRIYGGSLGLGVTLHGDPHWVLGSSRKEGHLSDSRAIVYFDAAEEKFKRVPQPESLEKNTKFDLAILGGSLCVVDNNEGSRVGVWTMREYGVKESWTKLFVFAQQVKYFNLGFRKNINGDQVVTYNREFVTYNLGTGGESFSHVMLIKKEFGFIVVAYVESLVSP